MPHSRILNTTFFIIVKVICYDWYMIKVIQVVNSIKIICTNHSLSFQQVMKFNLVYSIVDDLLISKR